MSEGSSRNTHRDGERVVRTNPAQSAEGMQSVKETLGGTPHVFTFAAAGLKDMKDAGYRIQIQGEFAAATTAVGADESTITPQGFSILRGAAAEVAHITVHGNIAE